MRVMLRRAPAILLAALFCAATQCGPGDAPDPGRLFAVVAVPDLPDGGKTFGGTFLDADGDGALDLLVSLHGDRAEILLNRGGLELESAGEGRAPPGDLTDQHGAAACDADGDGDWDVLITNGAHRGLDVGRNRLWLQAAPGRFVSVADEVVADPLGRGRGALWIDVDGDGPPELLLLNYLSPTRLLGGGGNEWRDESRRLPIPRAPALQNLRTPVPDDRERSRAAYVHAAVAADFDDDGRTDLFTLGRPGVCGLWINAGGSFWDHTCGSGLKPALFPHMPHHAVAGDIDGDGDPDLVLLYRPDPDVNPRRGPVEIWRNDPGSVGPIFSPLAAPAAARPLDPVAGLLADLDGDGALDLYVVEAPRTDGQPPNALLHGDGRGGFADSTAAWGGTAPPGSHPESAWAMDLDRDGDLDLLTFNGGGDDPDQSGGIVLHRNDSSVRHGLTVELAGGSTPHGLGARLTLSGDGFMRTRRIRCVAAPHNAAILPAHFGVGGDPGPFALTVRWPSGATCRYTIPAPGAAYRIREADGAIERLEDPVR